MAHFKKHAHKKLDIPWKHTKAPTTQDAWERLHRVLTVANRADGTRVFRDLVCLVPVRVPAMDDVEVNDRFVGVYRNMHLFTCALPWLHRKGSWDPRSAR